MQQAVPWNHIRMWQFLGLSILCSVVRNCNSSTRGYAHFLFVAKRMPRHLSLRSLDNS
jgi:hypothetical protein